MNGKASEQIDARFLTTEELLAELGARSKNLLIVHEPKIEPGHYYSQIFGDLVVAEGMLVVAKRFIEKKYAEMNS